MRIPILLQASISVLIMTSISTTTRAEVRIVPGERPPAAMRTSATMSACPVTTPNGRRYAADPQGGNHGNKTLTTELWPNGRVDFRPGGSGCVEPDGYLGMKWPWWSSVRGRLMIEGRRLDGPAGPLRASFSKDYEDAGFRATGLLFAGPGCWEVTARVGDASLSFVTLVVKTAEGPAPRCAALFPGFQPSAHVPKQGQK